MRKCGGRSGFISKVSVRIVKYGGILCLHFSGIAFVLYPMKAIPYCLTNIDSAVYELIING